MRYCFDDYTLDTDCFELSNREDKVHIEPQALELLALLIQNSDRMVSKDEINQTVWRGRVVSDSALSSRIKMLRQVLGDSGREQRIIRTIHKKGFRFVAPLVTEAPQAETQKSQDTSEPVAKVPASFETPSKKNPGVAVLPFSNLSSDPQQEYFSDGITTDIISNLAKHRWLKVTARNTCFGYKNQSLNLKDLGRELGVQYVVEGSVQRSGGRVRINVNLIDTSTGMQQWSERYDREIDDIFALQDAITETIVARLEPEIGFAERNRVALAPPANLAAWDCFHLGIFHFYRFTGEDNIKAQQLLHQSAELDPDFGDAYAWWAYAVILGMVYWDTEPTPELLVRALAACDKALAIDRQNATFYALKARVLLACREYKQALKNNNIAIEMNPSFAAAYCGLGDSLAYEQRYEESIEYFKKSIALSPNDPQLWAFYTYGALAYIFKGEYEQALNWLETALTIPNHQYWTIAHKVVALAHLNQTADLASAVTQLKAIQPEFSIEFARSKLFYLKEPKQIELYLDGLRKAGID